MTRWRSIARQEIRGLRGSRTAKLGVGLVVLVFVGAGYVVPTGVSDPTMADYDTSLRGVVGVLVPLFGLLLGYRSVVGRRTTGRLTLALSFPHSRGDIVLGTAVGRGLVLAATTTVGVLGGAALVAYPFGSVEADALVVYLGATLLFGGSFLAIGLGLSTLTASLRRATVLTFAVFFLFVVAWPELDGLLLLALEYVGLAEDDLPGWAQFLHGAEPGLLYRRVLDAFVTTNRIRSGAYLGAGAPWYLGGAPAVALLVGWVVVPVVAGYLRFRGTDL